MLKVLCDANGIWFMGDYQGNEHVRLAPVKFPLCFQIKPAGNRWRMEFGPYDVMGMPKEIRARLNNLYDPSPAQVEQYISACVEIYKEEYNGITDL